MSHKVLIIFLSLFITSCISSTRNCSFIGDDLIQILNNIQPYLDDLNNNDQMGYTLSGVLANDGYMYRHRNICWAIIRPYSKREGFFVVDGELAVDINPTTLEVIQIEPAEYIVR